MVGKVEQFFSNRPFKIDERWRAKVERDISYCGLRDLGSSGSIIERDPLLGNIKHIKLCKKFEHLFTFPPSSKPAMTQ